MVSREVKKHIFFFLLPIFLLEKEVCSINGGKNTLQGAELEETYCIKEFKDGSWDCKDRAELLRTRLRQQGVQSFYGYVTDRHERRTHVYVKALTELGIENLLL